MSITEALILGFVQGLTEFLPVSSSGHTIIAGKLLGLYEVPMMFELTVHLATLLAVIIAMRKRLLQIVQKPFGRDMRLILAAAAPTVIVVVLFESFFRSAFDGRYLIYCFLITAVLIIVTGLKREEKTLKGLAASADKTLKKGSVTYTDAVIIGLVQGAAALPGISRSGATICTARLLGVNKKDSAEFSFLISIPVIIGSSIVEFITNSSAVGIGALPMIAGFLAAFASGLLGVFLLMKALSKLSLDVFAVYLFCLSIFLLLNDLVIHLF